MMFDEQGHIQITPRELKQQAFDDPDGLINHALMPGTPLGFPTYEKFVQFVDYLSDQLGIHPHHFLFRGSTKIGFSISPKKKKVWRQFGPNSDLDLAIADPHYYATLDEEVRRHDRIPENRKLVFQFRKGYDFEKYKKRVDQKGRHDCYRFFDLPRGLPCLLELNHVLKNAPIADCCVYNFIEFEAFIFRDRWAVHRRYHTDLNDLRKGLTAKHNRLPQPPEKPFSSDAED